MKIPKICEYCGGKVILTDAVVVCSKNAGKVYLCTNCNAYVFAHKDSNRPMGTLANTVLRLKRQEAHRIFDAAWKMKNFTRSEAYEQLAECMDIPKHRTHIAFFNVEQCDKVIRICQEWEQKKEAA